MCNHQSADPLGRPPIPPAHWGGGTINTMVRVSHRQNPDPRINPSTLLSFPEASHNFVYFFQTEPCTLETSRYKMASEEERAKIMAEYMDSLKKNDEDDLEDEDALDYSDEDEDDGEFTELSDNDDNDDNGNVKSCKETQSDHAVLQGSLSLSDEGRLIYTGTWTMKSNLDKQKQSFRGSAVVPLPQSSKIITEKKKTKFKLKSKHSLQENFLTHPLSDSNSRTLLLDGFFTTDETDKIQPYRKVKERDVEFTFTAETAGDKSVSSNMKGDGAVYSIQGRGTNDFGSFSISGTYAPTTHNNDEKNSNPALSHGLTCSKRYAPVESSSIRKRRRGQEYDDDDEISDDGGADLNEVIGLHEDANLSVEELRKRYYGNGAFGGDNDDKMANGFGAADVSEDPDEDDGCGF